MNRRPANEPPLAEDEKPNLFWFHTWSGVYWFVLACFLFYLVLLSLLSRAFS